MEKSFSRSKKNRSQNNYLGFTLTECLLALLVLSVICILFSASVKHGSVVTKRLKSERKKEWHIFMIQLENELKDCRYEKTQNDKIILRNKRNNKTVWIEYKLGKLVKVENGGYHPLLTDVKQAIFIEENNSVKIKVTLENNENVTTKWIIPKEKENEK
ncbi:competence type IV pilus minor pilin ComGF [Enterococcus quebecensis]|uniref:Prepilin-type N-terminal cleavage/methylation domain-containing protein n=1 Tax=Enterococcus quebecensis TaxID=903983 RepID=A0A1E5GX68_9ENTE|nr:competence type IV pilus minor pilin ComGF [Enterococcus quebecensis]OEG17263.1 prepilin-type N-terminal cleavage/methylation domain-containing protein [Enterococcus quebecensis]